MNSKDRIVKLEPCDGAVLAIAGTNSKFTVLVRSMMLTAAQFELRTSYDHGPTSYLVGKCRLDKHDSISIIGYDDARAIDLNLTIRGGEVGEIGDTGDSDEGPHTAAIGYMEDDRELGTDSGFFLELTVSNRTLEHLVKCVTDELFRSLRIGVKSYEIYNNDFDRYSYQSRSVTWYLRPQKQTGRADFPETARGRLELLVLVQKSTDTDIKHEAATQDDDEGVRDYDRFRAMLDNAPAYLRAYRDVVVDIAIKVAHPDGENLSLSAVIEQAEFIGDLFESIGFAYSDDDSRSSARGSDGCEPDMSYSRWRHRDASFESIDMKRLCLDRDRLLNGVALYLERPNFSSRFLDWYCAQTLIYSEYIAFYKTIAGIDSGALVRFPQDLKTHLIRSGDFLLKWGIWVTILFASEYVGWWATTTVLIITAARQVVRYRARTRLRELLTCMRGCYDVFKSHVFSWEVAWMQLNRARELGAAWDGELYRLVELRRYLAKPS